MNDNFFASSDTILFVSGKGLDVVGTTIMSFPLVQINESLTSFGNECDITIGSTFYSLSGELIYY